VTGILTASAVSTLISIKPERSRSHFVGVGRNQKDFAIAVDFNQRLLSADVLDKRVVPHFLTDGEIRWLKLQPKYL
jgi:hypothetical protein